MSASAKTHGVGPVRREAGLRGRTPLLLAGAVLVALACGVLIGRITATTEPTPGLASGDVSAMLAGRVAAVNGEEGPAIGTFYTPDAVMVEQDVQPPVVSRGRDEISDRLTSLRSFGGFAIQPHTHAIRVGDYVAEGLTWTGGMGVVVYELDGQNKISRQWVIGGRP